MKVRGLAIRAVKAVVVIALIAVLNFFLVRMAPGDPAQFMAGQSGSITNGRGPGRSDCSGLSPIARATSRR